MMLFIQVNIFLQSCCTVFWGKTGNGSLELSISLKDALKVDLMVVASALNLVSYNGHLRIKEDLIWSTFKR